MTSSELAWCTYWTSTKSVIQHPNRSYTITCFKQTRLPNSNNTTPVSRHALRSKWQIFKRVLPLFLLSHEISIRSSGSEQVWARQDPTVHQSLPLCHVSHKRQSPWTLLCGFHILNKQRGREQWQTVDETDKWWHITSGTLWQDYLKSLRRNNSRARHQKDTPSPVKEQKGYSLGLF